MINHKRDYIHNYIDYNNKILIRERNINRMN